MINYKLLIMFLETIVDGPSIENINENLVNNFYNLGIAIIILLIIAIILISLLLVLIIHQLQVIKCDIREIKDKN